ncbi:nucleotide exchange factor SIL1 [Coccinella septempunctata]|uniref:nucleotide exchange factor SIL1 n=1 Tax=Coccinella septempunctata TaxID=41139 RepID=UPI001D07BE20|nr:nucleotide exchange factor SIL1 [Coccinella septempunctata]
MNFRITLVFALLLQTGVLCNNEEEDDIFIPDSEWKEIKQGQKIPSGLHVRINLQTGKKEAKYPDDQRNQALVVTENDELKEKSDPSSARISIAEIKKSLKKIKNDANKDNLKTMKTKFRNYEEIKKELGHIQLTPKLDSEVIRDLMVDFREEISGAKNNTRLKNILEDLEYLSHQIDNAIEFVNQNGFKNLIYANLNQTNLDIKIITLRLMSSLMQNNPKVQIHGLETGCISELLKVLNLEKNIEVKYQAVGALSSILRRFPLAQKKFLENGGLTVFSKIFEEADIKMNVKLLTLVVDLVSEHQYSSAKDGSEEALKQYEKINMEEKLIENNWCYNINKLLYSIVAADEDNHDFVEKCLKSMNILRDKCATGYDSKILNYLYQKYNRLGLDDIEEDEEYSLSSYFSELKELCHDLLQANKSKQKTELYLKTFISFINHSSLTSFGH